MAIHIIVDSTADLFPQDQSRVMTVPMVVRFGETEYVDGVTITTEEFYKKLVQSEVLPTTSQATPNTFGEIFSQVPAEDTAVMLTLSSTLSGTYQSACIAAADFENIYVVDSLSATIGIGVLAHRAFELIEEGLDAAAIAEKLDQEKQDLRVMASIDTLEYLKKGGRISSAVAIAGALLNIKPLLSVVDGQLGIPGKARGAKQAGSMVVSEMEKTGGVDFSRPVMLGYCGNDPQPLANFVEETGERWIPEGVQLPQTIIGSVIGTHVGPGAYAVGFFKKN